MVKANLLITYDPSHLKRAKEEVTTLLEGLGIKGRFLKSEVGGILKLRTNNPKEVVKSLVTLYKKKPKSFGSTCRWIPIDKWCKSELGSMKRTVKKFANDIKDNESWKMDLEKRLYDKHHTTELILELTKSIDKMKVNLSKPKKIIKVEVIGKQAGFSLLSKNEMLRASSKK